MHCLLWDGSHANFTLEWQWHGQNFELHPHLIKGCPKSFEGLSYDAVLLFFGKNLFCPKQSTRLLWHRLYLACKTYVSFFICLNWKMNGRMYSELLVQYWKILALNMNEIIHQEKHVPNILHFKISKTSPAQISGILNLQKDKIEKKNKHNSTLILIRLFVSLVYALDTIHNTLQQQ